MIPQFIAAAWLGKGAKYILSRRWSNWRHPGEWDMPIYQVLARHGLKLNGAENIADAIYALRGAFRWDWDPLHGLGDYVKPPYRTLADKRGDCDDAAVVHAQVIAHSLRPIGWKGRIVSYLSGPDWALSHHFAAGVDPQGGIWPVQPPPAEWQDPDGLYVWGHPCESFEQAAIEVADSYSDERRVIRPVAFDVRDPHWQTIEPWRRPR